MTLTASQLARFDTFPLLRPHREWLTDPGGSPRRRRWLEFLRRWGFAGHGPAGE